MKSGQVLYNLKGIDFSYNKKRVLKNITLQIPSGKFIGILGPNGSGKSTLLDILAGLQKPHSGKCELSGKNIKEYQQLQLAKFLALMPQDFSVRFDFKVSEVIAMGRHPHISRFAPLQSSDYELIEETMKMLDISDLADRNVRALSGGEQQRVALARVLVQTPEVLLLDEFSSNLDIYHTLTILKLLKREISTGSLTVISAVHDINQAALFCDELIFIKKGEIIAMGKTEKILTPDIIYKVYGVNAEIKYNSKNSRPYIIFETDINI
jgi:iron complex transport system ATP-binding protein